MSEETTFIRPGYRRTSAGHSPVDGVQFHSYSTGVLSYARISEDGQIFVADNGHHRHSYGAAVIGHGPLKNDKTGKSIRFRSQMAATKAAVKVWKAREALAKAATS
jgi:hypothetical protein